VKTEQQSDARDIDILKRCEQLRASLAFDFLKALRARTDSERQVRTTWRHRSEIHVAQIDAAEVMRELMFDAKKFTRYLAGCSDSSSFKAYEHAAALDYADTYCDSLAEIDSDEEFEEEKIFRAEERAAEMIEFRRTA
jgi:hypothetical protein